MDISSFTKSHEITCLCLGLTGRRDNASGNPLKDANMPQRFHRENCILVIV